jgi:hypothetical protein
VVFTAEHVIDEPVGADLDAPDFFDKFLGEHGYDNSLI